MEDFSLEVVNLLTKNEIGFSIMPEGIMFHSPADREWAEAIMKVSP